MDQALLVDSGHQLIELLEREGLPPRAVMWVSNPDTNTWKLWVVPHNSLSDKREFYRKISSLISKNRDTLHDLDGSDVEMIQDDHPAMKPLRMMFNITGKSFGRISNNRVNGFYIPDGIILRMDY